MIFAFPLSVLLKLKTLQLYPSQLFSLLHYQNFSLIWIEIGPFVNENLKSSLLKTIKCVIYVSLDRVLEVMLIHARLTYFCVQLWFYVELGVFYISSLEFKFGKEFKWCWRILQVYYKLKLKYYCSFFENWRWEPLPKEILLTNEIICLQLHFGNIEQELLNAPTLPVLQKIK